MLPKRSRAARWRCWTATPDCSSSIHRRKRSVIMARSKSGNWKFRKNSRCCVSARPRPGMAITLFCRPTLSCPMTSPACRPTARRESGCIAPNFFISIAIPCRAKKSNTRRIGASPKRSGPIRLSFEHLILAATRSPAESMLATNSILFWVGAPSAFVFSIGTNDLIQYAIAVDRVNERIAHLYEPSHPAVLRLIKMVADAARKHQIWFGVCGEMAGEIELTPLLLGLGVDELSVSPALVPRVKSAIRNVSREECEKLVEEVLSL